MKTLVVVGLSLVFLLVPATRLAAAADSASHSGSRQTSLTYHWPIKPFKSPHPIRGAFGDPRIVSNGEPFGWTGPDESAGHSFHNGIDIVAAPGTPVYPVVSGWVARAKPDEIVIDTYDGRAFQYYHLAKAGAVRLGRRVVVDRTVLGWIRQTYQHLHLAEIDNHLVHNPLSPGHLEPYSDRTKPVATDLYVDDGPVPSPVAGRSIGPGDVVAVAADDPPSMALPGEWSGSAQVPALVEWRLFHGGTRTPWKVAVDFRKTQPPAAATSGRSTAPAPTRTRPPSTTSITAWRAATCSASTSTRTGCIPASINSRSGSPTSAATGRPPGGR